MESRQVVQGRHAEHRLFRQRQDLHLQGADRPAGQAQPADLPEGPRHQLPAVREALRAINQIISLCERAGGCPHVQPIAIAPALLSFSRVTPVLAGRRGAAWPHEDGVADRQHLVERCPAHPPGTTPVRAHRPSGSQSPVPPPHPYLRRWPAPCRCAPRPLALCPAAAHPQRASLPGLRSVPRSSPIP